MIFFFLRRAEANDEVRWRKFHILRKSIETEEKCARCSAFGELGELWDDRKGDFSVRVVGF